MTYSHIFRIQRQEKMVSDYLQGVDVCEAMSKGTRTEACDIP